MSDSTPAPIRKVPPPASAVLAARSLWVTSIVVGVAAVVFAFLSRGDQLQPLIEVVGDLQPDLAVDDREPIAAAIIIGGLGGLAIVFLAEALLVRFMAVRARGRARWGLVAMVVLNVLLCAVAASFIAVGQYGVLAASLLAAQLLLACAALVASFLPSATAWFRREDQARRGVLPVA
jgi:hypothetical protein